MLASRQRDWLLKRVLLLLVVMTPVTYALLCFAHDFCSVYNSTVMQSFATLFIGIVLIVIWCLTFYVTVWTPLRYIRIVRRLLVALHGKSDVLIKTGTLTRKEYKHLNNFMCWLISNPPTEISGGIDFLTKPGEFKFFL